MPIPPGYPGPIPTHSGNAFAFDTMTRRVPATIRDIQQRNPDYPEPVHQALERLSAAIRGDAVMPPVDALAPDYPYWQSELDRRRGHTWLNTDWFFAETFFYRHVIDCTRWWETGRDPFTPEKTQEYASAALWDLLDAALAVEGSPEQRLAEALHRALWGNRIDLSFAASRVHGTAVGADDLLIDDTAPAVGHMLKQRSVVHLVADNAGTELAMDLVLVDVLLDGPAESVVLHVKMHPTFVSDAVVADVWNFLRMLPARGGRCAALAERLVTAFNAGVLRLRADLYWNSSRMLWEMPFALRQGFERAGLVIVKGDANYRRTVGDALWPVDVPFASVCGFFPAPLLALRTLKSDPLVGLPPGLAEHLDTVDERWRYNGRRGVIQFKP